ncbi:MAG: hypothetical protein ACXWQZ_05815 [Ktedonobacterales bacterium]
MPQRRSNVSMRGALPFLPLFSFCVLLRVVVMHGFAAQVMGAQAMNDTRRSMSREDTAFASGMVRDSFHLRQSM